MAEWTVVIEHGPIDIEPKPISEGQVVGFRKTTRKGHLHGYLARCPRCGNWGDCPVDAGGARSWTASEKDGKLTMSPSILCACGGHYWLTGGVLTEC